MRIAGIMSGTSLDGIDVAVIDITGSGFKAKINVLTSHSVPYPKKIREALLAVSNASGLTGDISRLNFLLGELYAEALEETAERAQIPIDSIKLIGCHGQTIFHEGQAAQYLGKKVASTFQIGESSVISERTGIDVISNFQGTRCGGRWQGRAFGSLSRLHADPASGTRTGGGQYWRHCQLDGHSSEHQYGSRDRI